MLSLLSKTESELFPCHEHFDKDCTCNLYGYKARKLLLNYYQTQAIELFLLKFKILYNVLELNNSVIDPNWFINFVPYESSIPFEIDRIDTVKFQFLLKKMNKNQFLPICERSLYIKVINYKIRRINYPIQNNPEFFEYYTINNNGKYYTYLPSVKLLYHIRQFNMVLSILNQLITSRSVINEIDFNLIEIYSKKMINSTFLNGILTDSLYVKRDIRILDDILSNKNINYCNL